MGVLAAATENEVAVEKDLATLAGGEKEIGHMFDDRSDAKEQYCAYDAVTCYKIYQELEKIPVSDNALSHMLAEWEADRGHQSQKLQGKVSSSKNILSLI